MLPLNTFSSMATHLPAPQSVPQSAATQSALDFTLKDVIVETNDYSLFHAYSNQSKSDVVVRQMSLPPDALNADIQGACRGALHDYVEKSCALDHPNILKCLGGAALSATGDIPAKYALVYAAHDGGDKTLADLTRQELVENGSKLIGDVLAGLAYLHAQGNVHGALTANEVFICAREGGGQLAKITLPYHAGANEPELARNAQSSESGHACLVAPEQRTSMSLTSQGDMWRMGCIALQILSGKQPDISLVQHEGARAINTTTTPQQPIFQGLNIVLPPDASPQALDFLSRCLALHPDERASAQELLQHPFLKAFGSQSPVPSGRVGMPVMYAPIAGSFKHDEFLRWMLAEKFQRKPPFEAENLREICEREYRVSLSDADVERRLNTALDAAESHVNDGFCDFFSLYRLKAGTLQRDADFCLDNTSIAHSLNMLGIAHASSQGRRPEMEDKHIVTSFVINVGGQEKKLYLQGVFDGHAGVACANYAADNIVKHLSARLQFGRPEKLDDKWIFNALKLAMVDLSWGFDPSGLPEEEADSGTTANLSLIIDDSIWTINVGDSRAILVCRSNANCIPLSEDAKPQDPKYRAGIVNRGGIVFGNRVDGQLGVARSLGDFGQVGHVSARPKLTKYPMPLTSEDSYLLHVCDGLTDLASSPQLAGALLQSLDEGKSTEYAAVQLVASAYKSGSRDNMTAVIVPLGQFGKSQ